MYNSSYIPLGVAAPGVEVFVGGLTRATTVDDLLATFAHVGKITNVSALNRGDRPLSHLTTSLSPFQTLIVSVAHRCGLPMTRGADAAVATPTCASPRANRQSTRPTPWR